MRLSKGWGLSGRTAAAVAACCFALLLVATQAWRAAAPTASTLEDSFRSPADRVKPWVYWWWINGNVTEQSITRDLEQMKAKGIGGFLLFDSRGYHEDLLPPPPVRTEFLSPEWRRLVKFAMSESQRLGLQMSMNLSTNGGSLRAPWDNGEHAPKKLVWTSAQTSGPHRFEADLRRPDQPHFWEVAILAVRHGVQVGIAGSEAGAAALSRNWRDVELDWKTTGVLAEEVVDLSDRGRCAWPSQLGYARGQLDTVALRRRHYGRA